MNSDRSNKRAPGRPRCEVTQQAIVDSALELLQSGDYRDITIDRIAAHAKVGKQTIYRWWPSKADLFLEAYSARSLGRLPVALPSGDAFVDLEDLLRRWFLVLRNALIAKGVRCMIAEAQLSDEFRDKFEQQFVSPRRQALREVLHHGIELGQIRADTDIETMLDMILGAIWHRIITAGHLNEALAAELLALVRPALSAQTSETRQRVS